MKKIYLVSSVILSIFSLSAKAQTTSTYERVYTIFQGKCMLGCHSSSSLSGNLSLQGTPEEVYARLVNVNPTNPAAVANHLKRVDPGYPKTSYLFKKVNHGLDPKLVLSAGEGSLMPNNGSITINNEEIELIRQWILWGAPDTGLTYNVNLIHNFYAGQGMAEATPPPTPEEEGKEGYQVKFGPIFVDTLGEFEYFQPYKTNATSAKEIYKMTSKMSSSSHHWVLRSINAGGESNFPVSPMLGTTVQAQTLVYQYARYMGVWQFSGDIPLPTGTAIFQDSGQAILLNLHIPNYSGDSLLAATAYINIYTQPANSGAVEMHTDLATYGGFNPFVLQIPPTGQPFTLQNHFTVAGETRYFWTMQAHSHSRGTDYDMFLANQDGTKGEQIYEGFYNEDYTANQNYYNYTHPAVRRFSPLLEVDMNKGLVFEATWVNNTPETIPFGFTTKEEMFITYFQYTSELPPNAIEETSYGINSLSIYPNPSKDVFNLSYTTNHTTNVAVDLFDYTGKKLKAIFSGLQTEGKQHLQLNAEKENLASGIYFVTVNVNGSISSKKLIRIE